jgi:hypothetical protein
LSFLETCDNHDVIANSLPPSAADMTTFSAINRSYVESQMAIKEGESILSEVGASASTPADTIMGDKIVHKK